MTPNISGLGSSNYVSLQMGAKRQRSAPARAGVLFEQNAALGSLIFSNLSVRDINQVRASSSTLNQQIIKSTFLWKAVSQTFQLPHAFWAKRTEEEVRKNFAFLSRVNRAFAFCCRKDTQPGLDGATLRQKMVKLTQLQDPHFDIPLPLQDPQACFVRYTRPTVNQMRQQEAERSGALHEMLFCNPAHGPQTLQMFFACGEVGTGKTFDYLSGLALYGRSFKPNCEEYFTRTFFSPKAQLLAGHIHDYNSLATLAQLIPFSNAEFSMEALEMTMQYGTPPESILYLLAEYDRNPRKRLAEIIRDLIEKGATAKGSPRPPILEQFLRRGPLEFTRLFIEKSDPEVRSIDLDLFLHMLLVRPGAALVTLVDVLEIIKFMTERQPIQYPIIHTTPFARQDLFAKVSCFGSDALLQKLVDLGYRPNNDGSSRSTLGEMLRMSRTYHQDMDAPVRPTSGGAPYEEIARLYKFGARPPWNVEEDIEFEYHGLPNTQRQLRKLFGLLVEDEVAKEPDSFTGQFFS